MRIHYHVTGTARKILVNAISQELNIPIQYLGMPSTAYKVGGYTIDKFGAVTGADSLDLEDALFQKGFKAEDREYDEPDTYESGLGGLGATPSAEDLVAETVVCAKRELHDFQNSVQDNGQVDCLVVTIPRDGITDAQVQNLKKLIESKRTLLAKALGRPLTVKDTEETLQFQYPYSEENGVGIFYSQLTAALVDHVKRHQRVTAQERPAASAKFSMRTFLVRLGMNGEAYSAARKWFCRDLSGNASFSSDSSYAALKSGRKIGGQQDEQ